MSSKPPLQSGTNMIAYKHNKLKAEAAFLFIPMTLLAVVEEANIYKIK
jgi:hypothetical protein